MCTDFLRIGLSEHSISILDFEDERLLVDYPCSPVKKVRLRVFTCRVGSKILSNPLH
jgi:hypothetical protein